MYCEIVTGESLFDYFKNTLLNTIFTFKRFPFNCIFLLFSKNLKTVFEMKRAFGLNPRQFILQLQ